LYRFRVIASYLSKVADLTYPPVPPAFWRPVVSYTDMACPCSHRFDASTKI